MKLIYLMVCMSVLGGCATPIQKERLEQLHKINQAERMIMVGKGIAAMGKDKVAQGTKQYTDAKKKLEELM